MSTIDTIVSDATALSRRRKTHGSVLYFMREMVRAVAARSEKRRSRAALRELKDDQLRDIGLTRRDVEREVAKSFFWD